MVLSQPRYNSQSNMLTIKVKNVFEKLSPAEEEARLRAVYAENPYERKLSLSEYVYRRCEDVKQPMEDEEGPIQLWLAQHGPIRMRRRLLKDVLPEEVENTAEQETQDEEADSEAEETSRGGQDHAQTEDNLPKIPTKPNAAYNRQQQPSGNAAATATTAAAKNVKLLSRPMGLEAELPSEVRAAHDADGNAHAELDLLMVERATGIAYPTGYKIAYSRSHGNSEWTIEIV
ncbi:hypothetical protein B0O80DRAFT_291561 [Mortierella sp. GBAus27b]|nr:hypothetical protein B0O80DRAFT_291561 [Mortierella sp. GBAus27b]